MEPKRYVLADRAAQLPFRGRLFAEDGETMDPEDPFTRRLLADGSIRVKRNEPSPAADDGGSKSAAGKATGKGDR